METPIEDQARPFATVLGMPDERADAEGYPTYQHGNPDLLQYLGMNYYRLDTVKEATELLQRYIPNKQVYIAETGNIHHDSVEVDEWLTTLNNMDNVPQLVVWSPAVEMHNFEEGKEAGGYLLAKDRKERVDNRKYLCHNP